MLSLAVERLLAQLFQTISQREETVETHRQRLSSCTGFSHHSLFRRVSRYPSERCSAVDLQVFLKGLGVEATENEAKAVIRQYDSDGDMRWTVEEFAQVVLPAANPEVRRTVQSRRYGEVTTLIRTEAAQLFSSELAYHRHINLILKSLISSPSFSLSSSFRTLSPDQSTLTPRSLTSFLRRMGVSFSPQNTQEVLRRVDIDGDEAISIEELQVLFNSELAVDSDFSTEKKLEIEENRIEISQKTVDLMSIYWQNRLTALKKQRSLREMLRAQWDFDLDAAFTLFDSGNKGYASVKEVQRVLGSLGVKASEEEVRNLLYLHNGGETYQRLEFRTFGRMMEVEREPRRNKEWVSSVTFSKSTLFLFRELFASFLSESHLCHLLHKDLLTLGSSSDPLFRVMDTDQDGQISPSDVFLT